MWKEVRLIMGNVHTPKTIYKDGLVITFEVREKKIYYIVSKWNESGTNQGSLMKGMLGDKTPEDILKEALHMFGDVIRQ